jgi:hypothetical protein
MARLRFCFDYSMARRQGNDFPLPTGAIESKKNPHMQNSVCFGQAGGAKAYCARRSYNETKSA